MVDIFPENWAVLLLGLLFLLTLAQLLVTYVLSDSVTPPAGVGLFTVYFMATLLGWIAFSLQQNTGMPMAVDVPAVAAILNSYLLFLAAGQRARDPRGRIALGIACLLGCLSVFFLLPKAMYLTQSGLSGLFFAATGLLCGRRALSKRNVGDAIIAGAAALVVVAVPVAHYQLLVGDDMRLARVITFGAYVWCFALLVVGFLTSVLFEYQQHLSHLATEDPMTGLLNRRGLDDTLRISLAKANREDIETAAIMVDIDHFQNVNDSFGHEAGDYVLREVAATLDRLSRSSDAVARIGGEEFVLVLPDTDLASARVLAERICNALGERPLLVDQQRIPITVSLGVASLRGNITLDELCRESDRAMYLAKRSGRNRVASVEPNTMHLSNTGKVG